MKIYGHGDKIKPLEHELPPVVLFIGPRSVGKRTICRHLNEVHAVKKVDVREVPRLLREDATEVIRFMGTRPMGKVKSSVVNLDGASPEALNSMLKLLEEPPNYARFLLTTTSPTLLTVQSRATLVRLGYLTDEAMTDLLTERFGVAIDEALPAVRAAGGQVRDALNFRAIDGTKGPVLTCLRAAAERNGDLLFNALAKFDKPEIDLLRRWTEEVLTGTWRVFSPAESYGLDKEKDHVRRMAAVLRTEARPRLAAKLALMQMVARSA